MKILALKSSLVVVLACSGVSLLSAASMENFAGTWNVANFTTPSRLELTKNNQGVAVNVYGADHFGWSTGWLTVQSNGMFSGLVPDTISGTASPGALGQVVMVFDGTNGPPPLAFNANNAADFMTCSTPGGDSSHDLIFAVRPPQSIDPAELAGLWNVSGIDTPARFILHYSNSNEVVGIDGINDFYAVNGTMTVSSNGTFVGNILGAFTGVVNSTSGGRIGITVSDEWGSSAHTLFINASKDMMVLVDGDSGEANYQEALVFQKAPTNSVTGDLADCWRIDTLFMPTLSPVTNSQGRLIEVNGRNEFQIQRQLMIAGSDGFFVVQEGEPATGTFNISADGLVNAHVVSQEGAMNLTFFMNAGRTTLSSSTSEYSGKEFHIVTRCPSQTALRQNVGLSASTTTNGWIAIQWVAAPDRGLQVSSNSIHWETITNTIGQHSYSEPATNTSPRQFRVKQPLP